MEKRFDMYGFKNGMFKVKVDNSDELLDFMDFMRKEFKKYHDEILVDSLNLLDDSMNGDFSMWDNWFKSFSILYSCYEEKHFTSYSICKNQPDFRDLKIVNWSDYMNTLDSIDVVWNSFKKDKLILIVFPEEYNDFSKFLNTGKTNESYIVLTEYIDLKKQLVISLRNDLLANCIYVDFFPKDDIKILIKHCQEFDKKVFAWGRGELK